MNWKKAGNYALYIVPLYGVYDQFVKKPKEERSTPGIVFSLTAGLLAKVLIIYTGNGIATGEWNPLKYFNPKDKTEQIENISNSNKRDKKDKKCSELEKSINYDKLFIK